MCDTLMLAFWVWAVVWWLRGPDGGGRPAFAAAAGLITPAALSKYVAAALLPLLPAYTPARRPGLWLLALLAPAVALAGYEAWARARYGHGLLFDAASYATEFQGPRARPWVLQTPIALGFLGGGAAGVAGFFPLLKPRRVGRGGALLVGGLPVALLAINTADPETGNSTPTGT